VLAFVVAHCIFASHAIATHHRADDDDAPSANAVVQSRLRLGLRLDPSVSTAVEEALLAHLYDLPIDVVIDRTLGLPALEVDATLIVERTPPTWRISILRPGSEAVWFRDLTDSGTSTEVTLEMLGVALRSAARTLISDAAANDIPRSTRSPQVEAHPSWTLGRLRLTAAYHGTTYAAREPWQSGVRFGIGWHWPVGLGLELAYSWMVPVHARGGGGDLTLQRHPVELFVSWSGRRSLLSYGIEGGVVFDATARRARGDVPTVATDDDETRVSVGVGLRGRVGLQWRRVGLFIALGTEAWVAQVHYAFADPRGRSTLLVAPYRFRAVGLVGVAVTFDLTRKKILGRSGGPRAQR